MNITFNPIKLAMTLLGLLICLVLAHTLTALPALHHLRPVFDLESHASIPAWFKSGLLLWTALLLGLTATLRRLEPLADLRPWFVLSGFLGVLGIDAVIGLHELVNAPLREIFKLDGFFYRPWSLIALACVLVGALHLPKFLKPLPAGFGLLFVTSGVMYALGAVPFEMTASWIASQHQHDFNVLGAQSCLIVGELLELLALVLLSYDLLLLIGDTTAGKSLAFEMVGPKPLTEPNKPVVTLRPARVQAVRPSLLKAPKYPIKTPTLETARTATRTLEL